MKALSQAIPGALKLLLRDAPLSQGKVTFAWNAAVGPAMQRATAVHLERGTLLVDAATPQWGREVARSEDVILSRLHSLLGPGVVSRIEIRSTSYHA
jgi:hypothetical protein